MNKLFDRIYIINLRHRTDRMDSIQSELSKLNILEYLIIDATNLHINGTTLTKSVLAKISCFHSHIRALRDAYHNGYDRILILEDDIKVTDVISNSEKISGIYDNIKTFDWNILYLGGNVKIHRNCDLNGYCKDVYYSKPTKINDFIYELGECGTTHAICYTKYSINKLMELFLDDAKFFSSAFTLKEESYVFDIFLNAFTSLNDIPKHMINPMLLLQSKSYSDIGFEYIDHSVEMCKNWDINIQ